MGTVIDNLKVTTDNNVIKSINQAIVEVLPFREIFVARVASTLLRRELLARNPTCIYPIYMELVFSLACYIVHPRVSCISPMRLSSTRSVAFPVETKPVRRRCLTLRRTASVSPISRRADFLTLRQSQSRSSNVSYFFEDYRRNCCFR